VASCVIGPSVDGVICGDSFAEVAKLPANSTHLILSDIPYGIGLDDWDVLHNNSNSAYLGRSPAQEKAGAVFRKRGKPINGWSEADGAIPKEYYDWCARWAKEWLRVLKPGGSAFVFAGRRLSPRCIVAMEDAGFNFRDLLGWIRTSAVHRAQRLGVVYNRRDESALASEWEGWRVGNLRPLYEPIIWCFKPYKITIADNVIEHRVGAFNQDAWERHFGCTDNIITCGYLPGEKTYHPAQKPLKLMMALIELTTIPGQLVLDPFAGSGTTVVAAKQLGRGYLAIERDMKMCEVAKRRLGSCQLLQGVSGK
jgi:site-specific DNA-methyltransferase (adenine-specific)